MALHWDFREKAGTVTITQDGREFTANFYEGNSMMIVLDEYQEDGRDMYTMLWFFMDEYHAKNCLGLNKGHENIFGTDGIKRLTIYREHCRGWEKLVRLFGKAFANIEIHILATEPCA